MRNYNQQATTQELRVTRTAPSFDSFRRASQTMLANLKSPITVANSARRRVCEGGMEPPFGSVDDLLRFGPVDGKGVGVGAGDGDGEPKSRRVEDKKRDGSLRVDEN